MADRPVLHKNLDETLSKTLFAWGIETLTDVQEKALTGGLTSGKSMIISAPTSSGKTLIAEIAILTALQRGMRAVYLVSHRALADQKFLDFNQRFGETAAEPLAHVALSTGDRSEGDADAEVLVATYEKAIGLLLNGQIRPSNTLIVADELQILGDKTRGPDIETLCSVLKQRNVKQFFALTATVQNPEDLAGWLECELIKSSVRSTPLHQEIWAHGQAYKVTFGQDVGSTDRCPVSSEDLNEVVSNLLTRGLGPVLVFTETRKEAARYAEAFTQSRVRTSDGVKLAQQLDLFSEPTESSEKLKSFAERCVAFHTADLSAQERQVLEEGFAKSQFEVCFATSTLAAGVNFPFRTIVFPKLTYQYRDEGEKVSLSDYRNMSGRAGRLGLHPDGYAILLPKDRVEIAYANKLVSPVNEKLESELLSLSLRKTLLSLVGSRVATSIDGIDSFFENTLYWYQTLNNNPKKLAQLKKMCREAVSWLVASKLLLDDEGALVITRLGRATAISGLLPDTTVEFARMLKSSSTVLALSFDEYSDGIVYAACASKEFTAERPSRFLPYTSAEQAYSAIDFWNARKMLVRVDPADVRTAQCSQALALYIAGEIERKIARQTGLSAGSIQRLANDISWVIDGLHLISTVPDLGCAQSVSNQISLLARRVRWGVPANTLDLLRVAERHRVPGVGRQRAMALIKRGFNTLQDVLQAGSDQLLDILKVSLRVIALQKGVAATTGHNSSAMQSGHIRVAKKYGVETIVERCYTAAGTDYEEAVRDLLAATKTVNVTVLDDGKRQNVPDLLLKVANIEALLECKTATKNPALINKEDAWAVIQKATDFDPSMKRITLGKPAFDETSKSKAAARADLTLVENGTFVEAVLRLFEKTLTPEEFIHWITVPGVSELERLPGDYSYSK
jgi:helicase